MNKLCVTSKSIRIVCWPDWRSGNPYQQLFYDALRPHGIELVGTAVIDDNWLRSYCKNFDAIHFHWPEDLWRTRATETFGLGRGVVGLWHYLRLARKLGIRCIWTIHNLEHHEGVSWVDRIAYRVLANSCDLLICHSLTAAKEARKWQSKGRVVFMPHGNYDGIYPPPRPRNIVLRGLGLDPDKPAVCCVGSIRRYKGFDLAIEAINALSGQFQLIIGGMPHPTYDIASIRSTLSTSNGIVIINRSLSNQEFADIVCASEAVLLPYRKITGSGALLAAWTLGCGVLASDLPYFREMSSPVPDAIHFFPPGDVSALASSIREYAQVPSLTRHLAARRLAEHYSWRHCIEPVVEAVLEWLPPCNTQSAELSK